MPKYLIRLIILFVGASVAVIFVRGQLVPKTFGELGHYRAAALGIVAAQTPTYAGRKACDECHEEHSDTKLTHHKVACESCHGPGKEHSESDDQTRDRLKFKLLKNFYDTDYQGIDNKKTTTFCLRCHEKDIVRPASQPQVDSKTHKIESKETCLKCHPMHKPDENRKQKP